MNKTDLFATVAQQTGLSQKASAEAVNAVLSSIASGFAEGSPVTLVGFGTFTVTTRPARTGRNPGTGETIQIEAKKVIKFKPSKAVTEAL